MLDEQFQEINLIEDNYFWYKARREIIKQVLVNNQLLRHDYAVLEIGSANGANIEYFNKYFNSIKGSEINNEAIHIAKSRLPNNEIVNGWLPYNIGYQNESFDIIFLFDVLEHVEDDLAALQEIKKKFTKRGKLLITVPAYQFLFGKFDVESHHFRRYNINNLTELLFTAGYKVQYKSYFNCLLFPLVLVSRLLEKLFHKSSGFAGSGNKDGLINNILYKTMASEAKILSSNIKLPFGSSIVIVAEPILHNALGVVSGA